MNRYYKYDVAISFAEEDRDAAKALEQAFRIKDIVVYYYPEKMADTLGDLKKKLTNIYRNEARYAVVLLSEHYVNPDKEYVQAELAAIQSRMDEEAEIVYMVPVKLKKNSDGKIDPMQHPAFRGKTYLEWNYEPEKIVSLILEMLGKKAEETHPAEKTTVNVSQSINNTATNTISNNNNVHINNTFHKS